MFRHKIVVVGTILALLLAVAPGLAWDAGEVDEERAANQPMAGMALVPAGYFRMGSTPDELTAAITLCQQAQVSDCPSFFSDEQPARQVYTDAFYIDAYETTNAEYAECVAAGVCAPPRDFSAYSYPSYYNAPAFASYPVVNVTWYDAETYCTWRGKRLPTEAEWEKAARWNPTTGMVTVWPWGNTIDGARMNLCDQSCGFSGRYPVNDGFSVVAPVGSYPAGMSPVGAYDMTGNVWEWVADYYAADAYSFLEAVNPLGPVTGVDRIRRGGAYNNPAAFTRSANRKEQRPDTYDNQLGIRCGMSADNVIDDGPAVQQSLYPGGQAFVHAINDTLSLRTGPGTSFSEIEKLVDGTRVTIIDGPQVAGGYMWWYIQSPRGNTGWSVEYADGIETLIPAAAPAANG